MIHSRLISRIVAAILLMLTGLALASPASAQVNVSFHSFNGSVFFGRYPHTFVVFEGVLDTGQTINENFGFSAKSSTAAMTSKPAEHEIIVETAKQIARTNRHFTVTVSDDKYRELRAEVGRWRNHPGKFYDLDENNCIHFVADIARMVGLKADVPQEYLKKPKAWLNYVTRLNPQLHAVQID